MKKAIVFISAIIISFSLTSCGNSTISKEDYDAAIVENAKLKEELEKKSEDTIPKSEYDALAIENEELKARIAELEKQSVEEKNKDDVASTNSGDASDVEKKEIEPIHISLDNPNPVVYDKDGIKVSVSTFGYSNGKSVYKVVFLIENGSDHDVIATLSDVEINNFEISSSTSMKAVSAGKNGTTNASIWQKKLDEANITDWTSFSANVALKEGVWSSAFDKVPVTVDKECWTLTN